MPTKQSKPKLVLITGSGFSVEAGLPTTTEIVNHFLERPENGVLTPGLEDLITQILKEFWSDVFGFRNGCMLPTLEDHFTALDLAANSGHNLGSKYSPSKLRAIRRMSIHRVFQILDIKDKNIRDDAIKTLFSKLNEYFSISIVTLNWDIVAEKRIELGVNYGINTIKLNDTFVKPGGTLLLKVHGSSNWIYCDSCHRIYAGAEKSALYNKAFLEVDDFRHFIDGWEKATQELQNNFRKCPFCNNLMAGRVATFSYRKAFSINQFQTIWNRAHKTLSESDIWIFVGYSMPEADFEFRHLLKSAQLGRKKPERWFSEVILGDQEAENRYKRFFGLETDHIYQLGLSEWVKGQLDSFCREKGRA